jgi:hypothetical protein
MNGKRRESPATANSPPKACASTRVEVEVVRVNVELRYVDRDGHQSIFEDWRT